MYYNVFMSTYLVAGGAGYIGGVCVEKMIDRGDEVVIIDNLNTGFKSNVHQKAHFYHGDIADPALVKKAFTEHKIEAVLDFAALAQVGESVNNPSKYFRNNVSSGLNFLDNLLENGCKKIIFSSTAAVFGIPEENPISETTPKNSITPYGDSKIMFEKILERYHQAYGLSFTVFRYFNACGATKQSKEMHDPETHLIPIVFQTLSGKREVLTINGDDYNTPDGTCVRDYVHIADLIDAHLIALEKLTDDTAEFYNLGNGNGYSIKEVIEAIEKVSGKKVPSVIGPRRAGDPDFLVASSEKAIKELGWVPKFSKIEDIVATVWEAEVNPPKPKTI